VRPTMLRGAPRWWPRTRASRWAKVPNTPKFLGFWPKVQHGPSRRGEPCRLGSARAGASVGGFLRVLRGQVETDTGEMIDTGPLSMGGGHAGLGGDLTAAISHYDDVSSAVADVAVGEDAHGIWMAGALRPTVTPEQVRTLRASSVSGDWRPMGRHLALVAVLAVNVPGFSVPRPQLAASGEPVALVAAGVVVPCRGSPGQAQTGDSPGPIRPPVKAQRLVEIESAAKDRPRRDVMFPR
jgi:hypothetical protein